MLRINSKHAIKLGGITVLLIPHSQKHVYRFRVNMQWLYFTVIFLFSFCILSAITLFWYNKTEMQKKNRENEMSVWNNHKWIILNEETKIDRQIKYFTNYGNNLYYQIWDKPYDDTVGDVESAGMDSQKFLKFMQPLDNVLEFIIVREENYKNLPLGWPIEQGTITSEFGDRISPFGFTTDFHTGTDFANAIGTPIKATADGEIIFAGGSNTGYGNYVKILHAHGFITLYGHLSKILVQEKQYIKRGDVVALLGRSGSATGPHVHYEVRQAETDSNNSSYELFLNPLPFFKEKWN
ncbi:MAG: M23 family metallopeptidase [Spirochaetia bacterium]|nr:M23 family metallopeptidase [Spirochaetia bacterium]